MLLGFSSVYIRRRISEFPGAFIVGSHWRIPRKSIDLYVKRRIAETKKKLQLMSKIRVLSAKKRQ